MKKLPDEFMPLVHELLELAAARRQPASGIFELTSRCNLSCRMCYVQQSASNSSIRSNELSAMEWLALAQQAKDNGTVFLLLTGGEVFLRPDFFEIYEPLTRMGFILSLFTNGTLITEEIAKRLAQAPPSRTEITLYGATAATYEAVTRSPGSYSRCCSGIEALVSHNIPLALKTTLSRQNIAELEAMREMADNWGVPFRAGWLLTRRRDGLASDIEDCRLSVTDCVALEAADSASAHEWTEAALRKSSKANSENFFCQAGKAAFVISPSGEMNVCIDMPMPAVQPLKIGFVPAWRDVQRFVDAVPSLSSVCMTCDVRVYCPRCPAWSLRETNTFTEPVPYLCDIAHGLKKQYKTA